jgi:hypothetical protein
MAFKKNGSRWLALLIARLSAWGFGRVLVDNVWGELEGSFESSAALALMFVLLLAVVVVKLLLKKLLYGWERRI